jgi:hypothetical protein
MAHEHSQNSYHGEDAFALLFFYREIQDLGIAMINGRSDNTSDELCANTAH